MVLTTDEVQALRRLSELMSRASGQEDLQGLLDLIVEGAADVVGFRVAAISLLRPDDHLEVVAVGGDPQARAEVLGRRTPLRSIEAEFAVAEHWGTLRFVPADRLPPTAEPGWVSDRWDYPGDEPDSWDPNDTLLAPLYDVSGDMLGLLAVDLPLSGRRPAEVQQGLLEVFANQAGIAISGARQRLALAEQIRLAGAVRQVARISQRVLEPARVVEAVVDPIRSGLDCAALWIRVFDGEHDEALDSVVTHSGRRRKTPPTDIIGPARRAAEHCWAEHVTGLVRAGEVRPAGMLTQDEADRVMAVVAPAAAVMVVPVGSGTQCLGHLLMTRAVDARPWSEGEASAALEMGRDLGRAIVNARLLALERRIATQLRQADRAKTSLFATVAHELKNPLASIVGHLELLRDDPEADTGWSLGVMERNAVRMQGLVDDLLTLSRVSDPDRPLVRSRVDLAELARNAVDMFAPPAAQRGIKIDSSVLDGRAVVAGSEDELARVVDNLVSNAVKFSPDDGVVTLTTRLHEGSVELVCSDSGLGISEADQASLFTEFFRSTNPEALQVPGTGLGLSIVSRIVSRHGGSITVQSELGMGTTFTVVLPAA